MISNNMLGRVFEECSSQQIMSAECEEITPEKTDLCYYFPFVAVSNLGNEIRPFLNSLKSLIDNNGLEKPEAGENAQILCEKLEKLKQIAEFNIHKFTILAYMLDDSPEIDSSLICAYNGYAYKYQTPNKKNMETFVYREAFDVKVNYEKMLDEVKALDREIEEYLANR